MKNSKSKALEDVGCEQQPHATEVAKYEELRKKEKLKDDKRKIRNLCWRRGEMGW